MANDTEGKAEATEAGTEIALEAARAALGDLVIRAGLANDRFVITRHGKPTAALISIPDLERLRTLDGAA